MNKKYFILELYKVLVLTAIAVILALMFFDVKYNTGQKVNVNEALNKELDAGQKVFVEQNENANRDAVTSDLTAMAALAQRYYKESRISGGGGNSFVGWKIPRHMVNNKNGNYSIDKVSADMITIVGEGVATVGGGDLKVKVSMTVSPDEIVRAEIIH